MTPTRRVPQLNDDVSFELRLPPQTQEWADDLLESCDGTEVERTDEALIARYTVSGNCNAITNLRLWFGDVDDAMTEGGIELMEFTLTAVAVEPGR